MAKNSIRDYSNVNSSNTDIQSIDISEGCSPAGINNAIREVMADLKDVSTGAVALESPKFDSILDGNIKATDASGTDTAGTATTIKGGAGTGTGAGGSIIFQVADGAGSTGSSVNAHATAMTITDDGNVDIAGGLNVGTIKDATGTTTAMTIDSSGLTTIKPVVPAFSVYRNGDQAITSATYTKMQLNVENFDTNNFFDSTTNYRFQPTIAGYYQINGAFYPVSANSANYVFCQIYKNGTVEVWGTSAGPASGQDGVSQVNALIEMNGSTDYLEFYVYATGTNPVIKATGNSVGKNFMSGFLVRAI